VSDLRLFPRPAAFLQLQVRSHGSCRFGNAESTHLWAALTESSGRDVSGLMTVWTKQTGYPVVSLTLDPETGAVSGTQQRFFATGADKTDTSVWPVALGMSGPTAGDAATTIVDKASFSTGVVLGASDYVKANRFMNGVYRVMYDDALLARLGPATAALDCRDRYVLPSALMWE
jgi:aminopeptidase 2